MNEKERKNREYLSKVINPILEKMVVDLLIKKPPNPVAFMKQWLNEKGDGISNEGHHGNNAAPAGGQRKSKRVDVYGDESDDEEEEEVDELEEKKMQQKLDLHKQSKQMRTSVSAEVYGMFNKKGDYKPKVIPKSEEQIRRIKGRLSQAFMFSSLDEKDQNIVINAFEEKIFKKGNTVIKQGDDGDNLYVVDSGELDCFKQFKKDEDKKYLKTYVPGEAFGELSLLYNAPRAATIIAKSDSVCFALDRECFNNIVKESAMKKRESYEHFLGSVELLDQMDPYEKSKIADALKPLRFKEGEYIVREGERGDTFYFLEEGKAIATKQLKDNSGPEVVYEYKPGDYFGELALLKDTPRAANIIAKTEIKVVALDRQSFKRLLGPLEDILQRNFQRYEKFLH